MVHPEIYPRQLVEPLPAFDPRESTRTLYGDNPLRNPTKEECEQVSVSCGMREVRTLYASCQPLSIAQGRRLSRLGPHTRPKKSAAPLLAMLNSHKAALDQARDR